MAATQRAHAAPMTATAACATAAISLAGWATHAVVLQRRLAAARKDPLTGALGRDGFTAHATRIIARYGDAALVVLIDLDRFKPLNDTLGHAAGDQLLAATGARLHAWAGKYGTVGRLGGDEFAAALRVGPTRRQARLDQLADTLSESITFDGHPVAVTASIGAAPASLLPGTPDLPRLLRAADTAMYQAKRAGSGRAILAGPHRLDAASVNGRRAGRKGTHHTPAEPAGTSSPAPATV